VDISSSVSAPTKHAQQFAKGTRKGDSPLEAVPPNRAKIGYHALKLDVFAPNLGDFPPEAVPLEYDNYNE